MKDHTSPPPHALYSACVEKLSSVTTRVTSSQVSESAAGVSVTAVTGEIQRELEIQKEQKMGERGMWHSARTAFL